MRKLIRQALDGDSKILRRAMDKVDKEVPKRFPFEKFTEILKEELSVKKGEFKPEEELAFARPSI